MDLSCLPIPFLLTPPAPALSSEPSPGILGEGAGAGIPPPLPSPPLLQAAWGFTQGLPTTPRAAGEGRWGLWVDGRTTCVLGEGGPEVELSVLTPSRVPQG